MLRKVLTLAVTAAALAATALPASAQTALSLNVGVFRPQPSVYRPVNPLYPPTFVTPAFYRPQLVTRSFSSYFAARQYADFLRSRGYAARVVPHGFHYDVVYRARF